MLAVQNCTSLYRRILRLSVRAFCNFRPNAGQLQEKPPQRAPKRVRCWEEAVKQEPAELEASKAASAIPAEDVKMGTQAMEEDKAVPEEGELPDI